MSNKILILGSNGFVGKAVAKKLRKKQIYKFNRKKNFDLKSEKKLTRFLMKRKEVFGPVNLASPNPVTNAVFMREMRKRFAPLGIGFPAPTPAIYLGTMVMGTAPDLVLKSRKVVSRKLMEEGFTYAFSSISPALDSLL